MCTENNDGSPTEKKRLEEFHQLSTLFQFYLELVLKAFTFALGIAGGVTAFVLSKNLSDSERHLAAFGLLLPSLLCIGMGFAFISAVPSSLDLYNVFNKLKKALDLYLAPHALNLTAALSFCLCFFSSDVASFLPVFASRYLRTS